MRGLFPGPLPRGTLAELLVYGRNFLHSAGIEAAALNARVLLQHATGLHHAELVANDDKAAEAAQAARYVESIAARARRVPVAYLVGEKEFWGRSFALNSSVLVPRPETELLIECALAFLSSATREGGISILDLGTGSGALLVTLLAECEHAFGIGIDRSRNAIAVARANAERHGVSDRAAFILADWASPLSGAFDVIVANPPYLSEEELARAAPELRAEPRDALAAGPDGLAAYRAIGPQLPALLKPRGVALLEIGASQGEAVAGLLAGAGFANPIIHRDLAGLDRCVEVKRPVNSGKG